MLLLNVTVGDTVCIDAPASITLCERSGRSVRVAIETDGVVSVRKERPIEQQGGGDEKVHLVNELNA